MIFFRLIPLFLISVSLIACASWLPDAHRIDITQGNAIEREALDKVKIGMSKPEITQIIGNPLIRDPFHAERWDYIYRHIPGRGEAVQSRLTLYFEDGVLVSIDDSEFREPQAFEDRKENEPDPVEPVPGPEPD